VIADGCGLIFGEVNVFLDICFVEFWNSFGIEANARKFLLR
jgi:hypothetical protein